MAVESVGPTTRVGFDLNGLKPKLNNDGVLTVACPVFMAKGPILNTDAEQELREALGVTEREVEDALEEMIHTLEATALARMLVKRRVCSGYDTE
jgi:hypothetical protein